MPKAGGTHRGVRSQRPDEPAHDSMIQEGLAHDRLGRGRLLLVLDALLTTRSVTQAARQLGLQPSGVSRTLGELRVMFNDPLLIRAGRGLVPSPKAQDMHPHIQAVAAAIHALFDGGQASGPARERFDTLWNVPYPDPVALLATQNGDLPEDIPLTSTPRLSRVVEAEGIRKVFPDKADIGSHEAMLGSDHLLPGSNSAVRSPAERLAEILSIIGSKGKKHGRSLETEQAEEAMRIILEGAADPVQIGAFLSLIQIRGTTAGELTGFVQAARGIVRAGLSLPRTVQADLDWPCYISPKDQRPPWYFQAARLLAGAGLKVVLHGSSGAVSGRQGVVAEALKIPVCHNGAEINRALAHAHIAYVPLPELSAQLFRLLRLYGLLQARSPVFEVVHLLQPVPSKASLMGVSKPSYREIHRDAALLLGDERLAVVDNSKDVAQLNPYHATTLFRLCHGVSRDIFIPSLPKQEGMGRIPVTSMEHWLNVWTGATRDARAEQVIIATAAAALLSISDDPDASFDAARESATILWAERHAPRHFSAALTPLRSKIK